jgi:signal transduction histidine kinase
MFHNLTIRKKLTGIMMFTSVAAVLLAGVLFILFSYYESRQETVHDLIGLSDVIGRNCQAALMFNIPEDADKILSTLAAQPSIVKACILDKKDKIFAEYQKNESSLDFQSLKSEKKSYIFTDGSLLIFKQINLNEEQIGSVCLQDDLRDVDAALKQDLIVLALVILIALATAYLISTKLQKLISHPILSLASTAGRVTKQKDYSIRGEKQSEDEIGHLIDSFNDMLSQIQKRDYELEKHRQHLEDLVEERTTRLEEVNRELSEFAYIVSHDLKAPLRAIGQLSHWLSEDYVEALDEEGRKKINLLTARVKRMYKLIDDILAYSRAGRQYEKKEPVDLKTLTDEVIDSLSPPEYIRINIDTQLPVINGSRIHFQQVLQNLLSNSIKFMDKSGGIITIGCEKKEAFWRFMIKDNGPGIDQKYHEKIFQAFQTLSLEQDNESTGIGLSLVKKIIELYGGKIELESEAGKGCAFYFTLPE